MAEDKTGNDRAFLPFNFSTVAPFDALAVTLNELPIPQISEPPGPFSAFGERDLPTQPPSRDVQAQMLHLMATTVRDG